MCIFKIFSKTLALIVAFTLTSCGGKSNDKQDTPVDPPVIIDENITIIEHSPTALLTNVGVTDNIEVLFSNPIDELGDSLVFSLSNDDGIVEGQKFIDGDKFTFITTELLDYNSRYTASLSSPHSDSQLIENLEFYFTTKAEPEPKLGDFFPVIKEKGTTPIKVVPIESVIVNEPVLVSFGIPFPKGYLTDLQNFRIVDQFGEELAISAQLILPWRNGESDDSNSSVDSIRSVLTQLELIFKQDDFGVLQPVNLTLEWGHKRTTTDLDSVDPKSTWVLVDDDNYPSEAKIFEPKTYALFTPQWYGDCVIKTRLLPFNSHSDFSAYDSAFQLFGDTAINRVDPRVTDENLIPHRESYAAWLFDRAMTLYQLAFRSGEFKYIRAAHRASQFYLQHINDEGYFTLKSSNDLKYSYGESLVANYILHGDRRIPDVINNMLPVWDSFQTEYSLATNFWTERHAAFQLFGYVSAYEILGTSELANKAKQTFAVLRQMQVSPAEGVPKTGALMHTREAHSEGGPQFIASPWMSAMLISAVERYYIHFDDPLVSDFIIQMADFFKQEDVSLYEWTGYSGEDSYYLPYYLAGSNLTEQEHGGVGAADLEHTIDVIKIFSSAYFFSCAVTDCDSSYLSVISKLYNSTITYTFPYWIRASAPDLGYSSYRLAPPRKLSWWFKNSANNDFLLGENTQLPTYKETAPKLEFVQSHDELDYFNPGDEITIRYKLKNIGERVAKNVVIISQTLQKSPNHLLEITQIDNQGFDRNGSVVWKFETIKPNQTVNEMSFTVKVKDFVALQTKDKPIGSILSYADLYYCDEGDGEETCVIWENNWDIGKQTYTSQSNWQTIAPVPAITPPQVSILTPTDNDVLVGEESFIVEATDDDGIAKVDFLLDGELLNTFTQAPYELKIQSNALSAQPHELSVNVWDLVGSATSKSVVVTVQNPDVVEPSVTILNPTEGTSYCQEANIQYNVSDNYPLDYCEISLNGDKILMPECSDFTVFKNIPLFKANAHLTFDTEGDSIKSQDGRNLISATNDVVYADGINKKAALFDGNSVIEFGTTNLEIENDITVSFWIKPTADEGVILSQDWSYIGNEQGWAISLGANNHNNNNELSMTWSSGTSRNNANETNVVQTPAGTITLEQWQHVVIRKQNTRINIFIDGELITEGEVAFAEVGWPLGADKQLSVAMAMVHPDMYNQNFAGYLDDIAIWDTPLTDDEISQLYSSDDVNKAVDVTVYATDKAGNIGSDTVSFDLDGCN